MVPATVSPPTLLTETPLLDETPTEKSSLKETQRTSAWSSDSGPGWSRFSTSDHSLRAVRPPTHLHTTPVQPEIRPTPNPPPSTLRLSGRPEWRRETGGSVSSSDGNCTNYDYHHPCSRSSSTRATTPTTRSVGGSSSTCGSSSSTYSCHSPTGSLRPLPPLSAVADPSPSQTVDDGRPSPW